MSGRRALALALVAALTAGACAGPILANPPAQRPAATPAPKPTPIERRDPQPVTFPRDEAPHDRLTEWWYYTGHLRDASGWSWGFEYVVFRAERGGFPVAWASHLALTDEAGGRFTYAQRNVVGPQADRSAASPFDFDLLLEGPDPTRLDALPLPTWSMRGDAAGQHRLDARAEAAQTSGSPRTIGIALDLRAGKPAVLHDVDGWSEYGPAGGSYYYSRTSMPTTGTIEVDGTSLAVSGTSWFDHQWGDYVAVGGGGWDWFAISLDDGTDVMLSFVREQDGTYPLVYGTLVAADGAARHLPADAFSLEVLDRWTSPRTGADYPARWRIDVPSERLVVELRPTVADQELDARATTAVVYWEGSQDVRATRDGVELGGEAYVELTGYEPAG